MKKFLIILTACTLLLTAMPMFASAETLSEDIVILYTNDVHTYIDGPMSYDVVAAENSPLLAKYPNLKINYSDVTGSERIQIQSKPQQEVVPETGDSTVMLLWIPTVLSLCVLVFVKRRGLIR